MSPLTTSIERGGRTVSKGQTRSSFDGYVARKLRSSHYSVRA